MAGIPSGGRPKWNRSPVSTMAARVMEGTGPRRSREERRHEVKDFNSLMAVIEHGILPDAHGLRTASLNYMTGFLLEIERDRDAYNALLRKKSPTQEDARALRFLKITMYKHYLRFVRRKHWEIPEELEKDVALVDNFCGLRSLCAIRDELTEDEVTQLRSYVDEIFRHAEDYTGRCGLTAEDIKSVLRSGKTRLDASE